MNTTVKQLLTRLEKPENAGQIKCLANLRNLAYVENVKQIQGLGGVMASFALSFAQGHLDAFMALAECKTPADIAEFKKTDAYKKIRNIKIGGELDSLESLESLKELEELKNLGKDQ